MDIQTLRRSLTGPIRLPAYQTLKAVSRAMTKITTGRASHHSTSRHDCMSRAISPHHSGENSYQPTKNKFLEHRTLLKKNPHNTQIPVFSKHYQLDKDNRKMQSLLFYKHH